MPDFAGPVAIMAVGGALAAAATALTRPLLSLGILFLLASFSRATLETPFGTMRPEMPAIALVAVVLALTGRFATLRHLPRRVVLIGVAFGIYLAVVAISSLTVAPGTAQSMRMVAWLGMSMLGGVVALVLSRARPAATVEPLAFAGGVMGALGLVVALLFFATGPEFEFGIQEIRTETPRVYALAWESNLYAIFLGMTAFFALEASRRGRRQAGFLLLSLILIGFSLGPARAAYLGVGIGALAYAIARIRAEPRVAGTAGLMAAAGGLLAIGTMAAQVLLPNALERATVERPLPQPTSSIQPTLAPTSGVHPTLAPTSEPQGSTPVQSAEPSLEPLSDTLAFRLERLPIALAEIRDSPFIGFGAESFGQRHPERYAGSGPDHIAVMAIAVLYEAGIIGAAALAAGFLLLLLQLWRTSQRRTEVDHRTRATAAAFIGALVSVLVAYQANNAVHLAVNWIVIGAAVALTAGNEPAGSTEEAPTGAL